MKHKVSEKERRLLDGMLDAFLHLGPIEVLEWFAEYYEKCSKASKDHGHPAPWVDSLVADVRGLVTKYKPQAPKAKPIQ